MTGWLTVRSLPIGRGRGPAISPEIDRPNRPAQISTLLGERVLDPGRDLGDHAPIDEPLILEELEALRERRGIGAAERVLQLTEALRAISQGMHDAKDPFLPQRVQRGGRCALRAKRGGPAFRTRTDMRGGGRVQAGLPRAANGITGLLEGQPNVGRLSRRSRRSRGRLVDRSAASRRTAATATRSASGRASGRAPGRAEARRPPRPGTTAG